MIYNPVPELRIFFSFFVCGISCGLIFDAFRAVRRQIKCGSAATAFYDMLFWLTVTVLCAICVFYLNDGLMRTFVIVSFLLGGILYFLALSNVALKFFLKIFAAIIKFIKIFFKILLTPLKFSYKMLLNVFLKLKNKVNLGVKP